MLHTVYYSSSLDPYYNLALEEVLFNSHQEGFILYLWQNENTVVIGKNQNAWKECRISLLEEEGGKLARRSSGGGAVFHDIGNVNFTFITPREEYDVVRQLSVIKKAVEAFHIQSEFTGRNDLVVSENGAKFSGNAFRFSSKAALHHGTVLIGADMQKMSRYLAPSPDKLVSKGIESVRARVMNLRELNKGITIDSMKEELVDAFIKVYGPASLGKSISLDKEALSEAQERYASWEWRMKRTPAFDIDLEKRFDWGEVQMHLTLKEGAIFDCHVYSDAMDEQFIEGLAPALLGVPFRSGAMAEKLLALNDSKADALAGWIKEKGF